MLLLIQYTLIFASVLILVALGGCFSEHSGVINIGLEGIMVMGALGGALMMKYLPESAPAAVVILLVVLASVLVGMVFSLLLGVAAINFNADQTLVGTALNLLGPAAAVVIVRAINMAENPDNVSSTVAYKVAKKAFLIRIGKFEFSWFMLFALLILRGFWIARQAQTRFSTALAAGLISLIAVQTILNLCVVTNLLPSTGIALPFFSYGGTALAVNLGEMGIVLNISRKRTIQEANT